MIKFASNAFLATKISFANEIGNLCKELGIDSYAVFEGVGLDTRINPKFFRTGIGFGGSCFPKDVCALIAHAKSKGITPRILNSVMATNDDQPERMIALLKKHLRSTKAAQLAFSALHSNPIPMIFGRAGRFP